MEDRMILDKTSFLCLRNPFALMKIEMMFRNVDVGYTSLGRQSRVDGEAGHK